MSESKDEERIWLRRSESENGAEVVTESERNEEEKNPGPPDEKEPEKRKERRQSVNRETKWEGRPSLFAFYPFYVVGVLILVCTVVWELEFSIPLWLVGVLAPFLVAMFFLPVVFQLAWKFEMTESEARAKFKLWVGRSKTAPLDKVMDVVTRQGVVARLLNFGSVRLDTAGTPFPGVKFWGVRNPFEVEKKVRGIVNERKDEQG